MLQRAYSVLQIKAIDPKRRIFEGIATTPTPDRIGDVIEPLGIKFANPLQLLLYHRHDQPIGQVRFHKPTADGVEFTGEIPVITEEGEAKKRTDEAWHSLTSKPPLLRGTSIGFHPLNPEKSIELIPSTGGLRYRKTEVVELSLVSVPMNSEATVSLIKSLDAPYLAASGTDTARLVHTAGVSAVSEGKSPPKARRPMKKTITEQIKDWQATRAAKSARMKEIIDESSEKGELLDSAQSEEYDGLETEVKSIDQHLRRLGEAEKTLVATATEIAGNSPAELAAARGGEKTAASVVRISPVKLEPGIGFARAVKAAVVASQDRRNMLDVAKEMYPSDDRLHAHVSHVMQLPRIINMIKAAVPAGTTTQTDWASALVDPTNLPGEFIEWLRPRTIIGNLNLRRVPFNVRMIEQTQGGTGYWVDQGAPKPLTAFGFAPVTLAFTKVAAISVITEELARFSSPSAEMLVRDALGAAIIERIDRDLLDPAEAGSANVQPASLTNGLTALSSAGTSADNIRTDLGRLLQAFRSANLSGRVVLVMPESLALTASLMTNALGQPEFPDLTADGGTIRGIRVVTSQYVANASGGGNLVVAIAENEVFLADDGGVTVDASNQASLQMLDNPTNNSATATPTTMVSMWQTNSIALRAERFINWQKRRDDAVVYMDDVNWGSVGSPA